MYAYIDARHGELKDKLTFIRNRKKIGNFMNKDSTMKENCQYEDIVIDLKVENALIGTQVLNTINAMYTDNP